MSSSPPAAFCQGLSGWRDAAAEASQAREGRVSAPQRRSTVNHSQGQQAHDRTNIQHARERVKRFRVTG